MEYKYETPVTVTYGALMELMTELEAATKEIVDVSKGKSPKCYLVSPALGIERIKKKIIRMAFEQDIR